MKCELLIANKRSGKVWDVVNCTQTASWTTNRTGSPGTFKFTLNKCADIAFLEGDVVRFSVDGELQFYGWVYSVWPVCCCPPVPSSPPTQLLCRSPFRMGLWKRRRYTSISPVTGRL